MASTKRSLEEADLAAAQDSWIKAKMPLAAVFKRLRPYFAAHPACYGARNILPTTAPGDDNNNSAIARDDGAWLVPDPVLSEGEDWPKQILRLPDDNDVPRWMTDERLCAFTNLRCLRITESVLAAVVKLAAPAVSGAFDRLERIEFVGYNVCAVPAFTEHLVAKKSAALPSLRQFACDGCVFRGTASISGLQSWFARSIAVCTIEDRSMLPLASLSTLRELVLFPSCGGGLTSDVAALILAAAPKLQRLVVGVPMAYLTKSMVDAMRTRLDSLKAAASPVAAVSERPMGDAPVHGPTTWRAMFPALRELGVRCPHDDCCLATEGHVVPVSDRESGGPASDALGEMATIVGFPMLHTIVYYHAFSSQSLLDSIEDPVKHRYRAGVLVADTFLSGLAQPFL